MSSEAPRREGQEARLNTEAEWVQRNLRDEIEMMHDAAGNRLGILEHASKACAFMGLAPKGYHVEIEPVPRQLRHFKDAAKFLVREPLKTAIRHYIVVERPIGDSYLSISLSAGNDNIGFILREIRGREIGFEKKLNVYDLLSARVIRDEHRPQLISVPTAS